MQCNVLLKSLRQFPFNLNFLPKDARTILQTPSIVATQLIHQIAGGEYLHIGFKSTLKKKLERVPLNVLPEVVVIDFSTDGARLNKGSKQFWPIQYRILNIDDKRPIIAGVFIGLSKPTNPFDFFEQFVQELLEVRNVGILINNRRVFFRVHCFIGDGPARAFILNHSGHNSSSPCSKCKVEGEWYMRRMTFDGVGFALRTDEEYRNLVDEDHHHGRSPIVELLGLVTQVPFKGLHALWLGNVKKVLAANIEGVYKVQRLGARNLNILDSRMEQLQEYCPSEFNRRPNKMTAFRSFKGTELRQLGLYLAPSVLKSVFQEDCYQHFLILHASLRLLISHETPPQMRIFCQRALETYVTLARELYGLQFISYNVHCLLHIVADLELGEHESYSAFAYENNMPQFRKLIRKPSLPLQQYYKRCEELNALNFEPLNNIVQIRLSLEHADGPIPEDIPANLCRQFQKLQIGKLVFANNVRDCCCMFLDKRIGLIKNIIQIEEEISIIFEEFQRKTEIYNVGLMSDKVDVYLCSNLSNTLEVLPLRDVKAKCYRTPNWSTVEGEEERVIDNEWICSALLTRVEIPQN